MQQFDIIVDERCVAPHMGAWIEIKLITKVWLKPVVAPHMGAWIEIDLNILSSASNAMSRTPHGCVD